MRIIVWVRQVYGIELPTLGLRKLWMILKKKHSPPLISLSFLAPLVRPALPVLSRRVPRLLLFLKTEQPKDDDIPGKIVLSPEVLAEQQKGLEKIAQQLRRERLDKEAEDAITFGFCPRAELWNGRCVCFCVRMRARGSALKLFIGIDRGYLADLWSAVTSKRALHVHAAAPPA